MTGFTGLALGVKRGGIELRQSLTYGPDLFQFLFFPLITVGVLFLMRGHRVPGAAFSLGSLTLPGVIAMNFAMSGLMGQPAILSVEKEDGTLLRAKATPGGMTAYVTGKIVYIAAGIGLTMAMTLVLGLSAFPGVSVTAGGWLTLAWVSVLGLLATVPAGLAIGSLLPGPRLMPLFMLPFAGITAISGIFYPLTHLPGWLQAIGQVFPVYWLGLGMRAALLPGAMQSVELNRSWRLPDAGLVLLVWAVLGLAAAPPLLRRMARRESGSRVAARRERAMLRAT